MVRARIAPAPTGKLHLGTAHTALFNYLFAKHHHGQFILRIDDSDPKRSQKAFETDIIKGLKWLGVVWDEGPDIGGPFPPYRQSEGRDRYQPYLDQLLSQGQAYECFCTPDQLELERKKMHQRKLAPRYSGRCRDLTQEQKQTFLKQGKKYVIRFKTSPAVVKFHDPTRGNIQVHTHTFGDFVIARSDGSPLLVFATTIDDIAMKITHTIRGEDFLNLVPKQILLFAALDQTPPIFAHLHFIYGQDKKKLSKRHGAKAVLEYKQDGYLPEAMVTFLAYLSWSYQDNSQLLSLPRLTQEFTLEKVQKTNPIFDLSKLNYFNGKAIRAKTNAELAEVLKPFIPSDCPQALVPKLIPLIQERLVKLADFESLTHYLYRSPKLGKQLLIKQSNHTSQETKALLVQAQEFFTKVSDKDWTTAKLDALGHKLLEVSGWKPKELFMTLRVALTGELATPPLFDTIQVLGKKEVLRRLTHAQSLL